MKRLFVLAVSMLMALVISAQKVYGDRPGWTAYTTEDEFTGKKMIDMKFRNTSDRAMKYLKVYYYAVNAVGDVVSGLDRGYETEGKEYVKPKVLDCMGPFEPGKQYSRWASGVITTKQKGTIAVPYEVEIIYMQNDTTRIRINSENLHQYFPKNEWREYNRWNDQL